MTIVPQDQLGPDVFIIVQVGILEVPFDGRPHYAGLLHPWLPVHQSDLVLVEGITARVDLGQTVPIQGRFVQEGLEEGTLEVDRCSRPVVLEVAPLSPCVVHHLCQYECTQHGYVVVGPV